MPVYVSRVGAREQFPLLSTHWSTVGNGIDGLGRKGQAHASCGFI
jgi:hypothetical protein